MASVTAYIDGFNLYYGVKAKFGHRYLWLDLVELIRRLRPGDDILAVRYFTAVVKGEPAAAANQIEYLEALQAHCGSMLDIQRGWFKPRSIGPLPTVRTALRVRLPATVSKLRGEGD